MCRRPFREAILRRAPLSILFLLQLGVLVGCRPGSGADPAAGYYTGALPDGRTVWFRWEPSDNEVSGELRSLAAVEPSRLKGTSVGAGVLGQLRPDWDDQVPDEGRFLLRADVGAGELRGFWQQPGQTKAEPVRFSRFAAWEQRHRVSRLRFRQYGLSRDATAAWPRFLDPDPFWAAVNDRLEQEAAGRMDPFVRWSWEELKEIWNWPERGMSGEYCLECRWEVVWRTNQLVSLLEFHDTYLGGAHGMHGYRGANFQWSDGRLRELALADFFRPDSGWLQQLHGLVTEDLRRQEAEWYSESATNALADREFTFNAQGLQLYYDPYEVGSYAAGAFTVHLPWERLAPFLPTNGAVRLRPTGVVPRLPREAR